MHRTLYLTIALVCFGTSSFAQDCTTAEGLLLSPLENWELFNGAGPQISETEASVRYSLILERNEDGSFVDTSLAETAGIRITNDPATVDYARRFFQDEMFATMLEPGPLGYPVMMGGYATVLGDFQISVDGNGPGTPMYLGEILKCGLAAGLAPVVPDWEASE